MHNTYTTKTSVSSDRGNHIDKDLKTTSSSSSMDKLTSRNGNEGCQQMTAYGITWPYTRTSTTVEQPCIDTSGRTFYREGILNATDLGTYQDLLNKIHIKVVISKY